MEEHGSVRLTGDRGMVRWSRRWSALGLGAGAEPTSNEEVVRALQLLIEASPLPIVVLNLRREVAIWNAASERVFGWKEEEVLGKPYPAVPDDEREEFDKMWRRYEGGESVVGLHIKRRRKSGSILDLSLSTALLSDSAGRVFGVMGIFADITEQKRAEDELRKLSVAVEQSPAAVVITDRSGNIEYVNAKFTDLSGYSHEEALGKNPRFLKSGRSTNEDYSDLWRTIASGGTWRGELQNKKKNGELYWVLAAISPLRNAAGEITHFLSLQEDVSQRKHLEAQFLQAQKMEGIGRLAGGVAHDFNNLLTVILGDVQLLLADCPAGDPRQRDLQEIRDMAKRAADLTSQLLAFSRRQLVKPRRLNVNSLILGMDKMLRRLIGEDIELAMIPEAARDSVMADQGQLEQVIVNLAVNARDAMPRGGKLLLRTETVRLDAAFVAAHPGSAEGENLVLSVRDTGTGLTEEVRSHLFEPFYTTKEQGKGTGLGLATCYGIVKQNQGYIEVLSRPGQGAEFQICLPLCDGVAAAPEQGQRADEDRRGSESILLVEDDGAVMAFARRVLERKGYKVLSADNGEEALRFAAGEAGKAIALLVTDVVMPHMSGVELAGKLRAERAGLKVVFISGYAESGEVKRALAMPRASLLTKPFSPEELAKKVREVLDH